MTKMLYVQVKILYNTYFSLFQSNVEYFYQPWMENGPTAHARGGGLYHMSVNGNPVRMVAARSYNWKYVIRAVAVSDLAHVICQKEAGE